MGVEKDMFDRKNTVEHLEAQIRRNDEEFSAKYGEFKRKIEELDLVNREYREAIQKLKGNTYLTEHPTVPSRIYPLLLNLRLNLGHFRSQLPQEPSVRLSHDQGGGPEKKPCSLTIPKVLRVHEGGGPEKSRRPPDHGEVPGSPIGQELL